MSNLHLTEKLRGLEPRGFNSVLPAAAAVLAGMSLWEFSPGRRQSGDPFVLFDREGNILHQWPDEYVPSLTEVDEVCASYLK